MANYGRKNLTRTTSLMERGKYIIRDGDRKVWYENGSLWQHGFYRDGKMDRSYKIWYNNGNLAYLKFLRDDEQEGEAREWNRDGTLHARFYFYYGKLVDPMFSSQKKQTMLRVKNLIRVRCTNPVVKNYIISDLLNLILGAPSAPVPPRIEA